MKSYGVQNEVKAYCNRIQNETSVIVTPSLVKTLNDRVESLKKSGVWSQYGLGFNDADADSYFQRASVNNLLGRFEVCLFVRGIKTLGLWQNMVCWPLRSTQNYGSGTTAFSLGGLGGFEGTLVGGPTWTANGITTDSDLKYIRHDAGRDFGTGQFTFGACFKQQSFGTSAYVLGLYPSSAVAAAYDMGANATGLIDVLIRNTSSVGGTSRVTAGQMTADTFGFAIATRSDNTLVSTLNGNSAGTSSTLAAGVNFSRTDIKSIILGREATSNVARNLVTQPFAFIIKGQAIAASSFYTLYKETLGQGLGLP